MNSPDRDRQTGAVLVLSVLAMTALIVVGLAYLEVASADFAGIDTTLARAKVHALAEGGIEIAMRRLRDNPDFVGTIDWTNLGEGAYTVTVTRNGTGFDVTSRGQISTITSGFFARAEVESEEGETLSANVLSCGGDWSLRGNTNMTFDGACTVGGVFDPAVGTSASGGTIDDLAAGFAPVEIDLDSYRGGTTYYYAGDTTIDSGTFDGDIFCEGDLTLTGTTTVNGTLIVVGTLLFEWSPTIEISPPSGGMAALVGGRFELFKVTSATINGSIASESSVDWIQSDVQMTGSVMTGGELWLNSVTGNWYYDATLVDQMPDTVTGGPAPQVLDVRLLWRRPLVNGG